MVFHSFWQLVWALAGAFGTAWLHEYTGRDPRVGGMIGAVVGFLFGPFWLVSFWLWLYYTRRNTTIITKYRRWYEWWRP